MTTTILPALRDSVPSGFGPGLRAATGSRLASGRVWAALVRAGERRAAAEIARQLRMRGHRSTGDLQRDIAQLLSARGAL